MKAPLPPDESARLAAVRDYAVLDTPPEADFDSIATLAAQICDMPIALITLIDGERQWFKAKVGIEIESTPREVAFCAHAINRPRELLVVNDATKDPRFADNPYVTEANGIRFYAGAPLVTPGGHALGTLCVVDRKPREISAGQREALAVLSRHVMTQLQLRRQLRERQRIERALAVSEERWQFALEGSDQGVWDWDVPSQTVYFSPRWCAQLGHAPDEVPHRLEEWSSRVHPDDLPATLRRIQEHFEGRTPIYEAEFRMRAKDGTWRWIADRGKVMTRDAAGKPLRVVGTHIDITERRGLEEKLRRSEASLSRAQQVAHIGSWETDLVTMEVAWSEETHRIFGTSPATFQPNHESFLDRVHPEDRAKVHEAFLASLPADEARVMEHRICLPDGSVKHVEERWRVFREQPDRPARAVGTCQDITGRRQLEEDRKKLIRDLGERLKEVRALHQVSALLGKGGALTPAVLARIAGLLPPAMQYPEAAAARIVLGDLVQETPDYPPGAADRLEAAIDGGPGLAGRIEVAYRGKVPAAEKGPFLAEEHRLVESLAEMLSTHARRHAAEQALAETLECNRDLIRSIEGIVWEADAVTLAFTFVSEQAQRLLGYPTRAWLEEPEFWEEHIHPDDRAATVRSCRDLARQGRDHVLEYRMLAADGREVWLRDMVTYVAEPGRRPLLRGVMMDITERKLAEGEISALAHRLTAVLESITDAFYTLDRGWCFAYLNGEAERFLQRPKETLIGRTIWEEFPAAVGSTFEREYRRAMQERVTVVFEEFYPAPLNRWFEVRAYPSDEGLAVYFQDITERRRSAEALRLSEERFRELAENVADIFYNYDPVNHRLLYANPAYETIFGRSLEGAYAEPLDYLQGVHPDDRAGVEAALAKQLRGENTEAIFRVLRPDGSVRWVTEQAVPVLDAAGRVERLVGTMRDITERQEVINRLSVSEERFRLLSKATQDAIWDWDLVTGSFWWSEGFETLFGYSLVEIAPTIDSWSERVHPEDREAVNADVNRAIAQGDERWSGEYRFLRKDGSYAFIMDRGYIIRDAAGKAVRMIGGMTDVTELKRTESELRRKDALLRMAGRLTRTGGWSIELPGQQVFWSDEIFDILEYPPGQQPPLDEGLALYLEPWRQQVVAAVETCIRDGTPFDLEVRIRTAKGRTLWVRVGGEADRDATGVIRRVQGAMRDITERKQDEEAVRKSAGSLAAAQAIAHLGSWELDLTTGRSIWSAELFRLLHRDPAAGAGSFADFIQLVHPDDRPICEQANARLPEDRAPYEFEYRTNPALGAIRHLKAVTHVIRDEQDRAVSATGTVQDITERKQAEQELLRANQSLEGIVKALQQIGTAKSNLQDLLELIAAQTQTLAGASGATIEFIEGDEMVYRAGAGSALNHVGLRLARSRSLSGLAVQEGATLLCEDTETDARVDRAACRKVGVRSMVVAPLRDGEQIIGVLKILSDRPHAFGQRDMANLQILVESLGSIIQRRRLTEQMAASEEKYRLLFANNPQPMWVFDAGTLRFLAVNNAAVQHYGYSEAEFLAMTVLDIRAEDDRTTREQALAKMIHAGRDTALRRHVKKDGAVIEVEATSDSVVLDGRPARLVVARDVTERRRAEAKVREQAALLDKAQDAIMVRDLSHRITYWNKSAEQIYGWTAAEAMGQPLDKLLHVDHQKFDEADRQVRETGEWNGEIQKHSKTKVMLTISARWTLLRNDAGEPEAILTIDTDITERKKLEQQFMRAQRMESIGTLAGGIAHDLNNLLAPITMGVELLKQFNPDEKSRRLITNIERSAKRGADLVKQVLSFARGVDGARVSVHLKHLVREAESILENTFPKNIRLESSVPNDLWLVQGDPTQLNQILLNLCVNARDAMPSGGQLTIQVRNTRIDAQYAAMNPNVRAGPYVQIEVTDTGTGMPPEIIDRIFDPFFTTKDVGKGTGLGLATVQGIIRSHGGFITVYSEVGKGSTFKVYLPAQSEAAAPAEAAPAEEALPRGAGELILVVDDEATILGVTRQTLETFGYEVLTAEDGAQAIGLYALHRARVALVLTDMMMPVMDGPALITALQRINPAVRVIASSGLNANGGVARAAAAGVRHFLPKPYTAETLLKLIKQVLDKPVT